MKPSSAKRRVKPPQLSALDFVPTSRADSDVPAEEAVWRADLHHESGCGKSLGGENTPG